jgi:DNA-binding NarL/FixJ family response regulator
MNQPATIQSPTAAPVPARKKIALVEDQRETRESLIRLLKTFPELECVCVCASGEEALKQIPPAHPDVVLMDIFLPRMSGIECTARLKDMLPNARILILTASDDEEMVFPALEAGADGYLLKQTKPAKLRDALLELLHGGVPMTSSIARHVADYFRKRAKMRGEIVRLSPRETELLTLLVKGYSNKEIAGKLSLTLETIHSYLKSVYRKMHVRSRAEAAAKYMFSQDDKKPPL